ncbi:MAG: hypothetical protein AB1716_15355, partial [Planctomycetota bacterium]
MRPVLLRLVRWGGSVCGRRATALITALLSALSVPAGCERAPVAEPIRAVAERGPLKLVIVATPPRVSVGDTLVVSVEAEGPPEYVFTLPSESDFGPGAGPDFTIRTLPPPPTQPSTAGLRWRRAFELAPVLSGPLEIPALAVRYRRRAGEAVQPVSGFAAAQATQHGSEIEPSADATQPVLTRPAPVQVAPTQPASDNELVAGPLKIEVASALTAQDEPNRPRDITGTLLPPRPPRPLWQKLALAAAAFAVLAAVAGTYFLIRRRALRPAPPVPPDVWALRELSRLGPLDWLDPPQVRAFYYGLTEIVRRYIERMFGVAAPEMTTEEFLRVVAQPRAPACWTEARPCASPLHAEAPRLREMLQACDIVKYAAFQPAAEDGEAVLRTARAFVNATATQIRAPRAREGTGVRAPRASEGAGARAPSAREGASARA